MAINDYSFFHAPRAEGEDGDEKRKEKKGERRAHANTSDSGSFVSLFHKRETENEIKEEVERKGREERKRHTKR